MMAGEPTTWAYTAVSPAGVRRKATMVASSSREVSATLEAEGWIPLAVSPQRFAFTFDGVWEAAQGLGSRITTNQLTDWTLSVHQLLRAGLSVPATLESMSEDRSSPLAEISEALAEAVTQGEQLSEAMAAYPKVFDAVYRSYISAGETTGGLVPAAERLADMLTRKVRMRNKIQAVMTYPVLIGATIAVLVIGIVAFLVPRFTETFESLGAELPAATQALVTLSDIISPISSEGGINWFSPLLHAPWLVFLLWKLWVQVRDRPAVASRWDRLRFRLPIFGKLLHKLSLYRWASTFASALESGVSEPQSLELAANASGSRWQQQAAVQFQDALRSGRSLSTELTAFPFLYPPKILTLVKAGEEAGEMAAMVSQAARAYDDDIDRIVSTLSSKIEVALLLTVGAVVGSLIFILYLPIFELSSSALQGLRG